MIASAAPGSTSDCSNERDAMSRRLQGGDDIFATPLYEQARGEAEATVERCWPLIETARGAAAD
jgi:hypothetical protein